jgi:hypothetical protein
VISRSCSWYGSVNLAMLLLVVAGCASPASGKALFEDDFEDSSGSWTNGAFSSYESRLEDGALVLVVEQPHWLGLAHPKEQAADVAIDVDATLEVGSYEGHYGAVCRMTNMDNFYYFAVDSVGYYGIFARVEGSAIRSLTSEGTAMTYSPAIDQGREPTHIRIICQGNRLTLIVNEELVETVHDESLTDGYFGVGAGSGPAHPVQVRFDDFVAANPQ